MKTVIVLPTYHEADDSPALLDALYGQRVRVSGVFDPIATSPNQTPDLV